jgi:hypothetical protein
MSEISYDILIPGLVRRQDISKGAMLLYGEIRALAHKRGYCWARNSYFAKVYQCNPRSIQGWLKELAEVGAVCIDHDPKRDDKQRRITPAPISKEGEFLPVEGEGGGVKSISSPPRNEFHPSKYTSNKNNTTNVESTLSEGRKREDAMPPEEEQGSEVPASANQACKTLSGKETENKKNQFVTGIFTGIFGFEDHDPFRVYHGRLARMKNQLDAAGEDGHEWLLHKIYDLREHDDFAPGGTPDYRRSLPLRALDYLQKIVSSTSKREPESGVRYDEDDVEQFVNIGYDRDEFEKVAIDEWQWFPDD